MFEGTEIKILNDIDDERKTVDLRSKLYTTFTSPPF